MKLEWEAPTHLPISEAQIQSMVPGNLVCLVFQVWLPQMQSSGSPGQRCLNKLTAHSGRPPVHSNSVLAALVGICWDTGTETLTVTTLVTATSVCQAVGVKPGDINLEMKISLIKSAPAENTNTATQSYGSSKRQYIKPASIKHFTLKASWNMRKKMFIGSTIKSCPALSNTIKSMTQ